MIRKLLIDTLEKFGYPVILQGSMSEDEPYPDSFLPYYILDSSDHEHFDGEPVGVEWALFVAFYTNDPELLDSVPGEIYEAMRAAGFIPQGRGHDTASDEPTHQGWVNEYYYLEF